MSRDSDPATSAVALVRATCRDTYIDVEWADGEGNAVHALWLRDNCPCPECLHPESGQRLFDIASMPDDLDIGSARVSAEGSLDITWVPDGHLSSFTAAWLRDNLSVSHLPHRTLWDATTIGALPEADYASVHSSDAQLRRWLSTVEEYGFALLHGVPTEPASILRVVDLFGYVRETNYGRLFDVRSVVNPSNLAYTGLPLGPHTDNPYRGPTPTLQLLHCLSSSVSGGDTTLVDGFRIADELRHSQPALFEILSTQPVQYRYRDQTTDLAAEFPVISCDVRGNVSAIHFNNRSRMPFALPVDLMEAYYMAYLTFAYMLVSPSNQISLRLEAGDLVIMDNLRVLHGRTGFAATGERHLQGCYADRDGLLSRLAVLNCSAGEGRQEASVRWP